MPELYIGWTSTDGNGWYVGGGPLIADHDAGRCWFSHMVLGLYSPSLSPLALPMGPQKFFSITSLGCISGRFPQCWFLRWARGSAGLFSGCVFCAWSCLWFSVNSMNLMQSCNRNLSTSVSPGSPRVFTSAIDVSTVVLNWWRQIQAWCAPDSAGAKGIRVNTTQPEKASYGCPTRTSPWTSPRFLRQGYVILNNNMHCRFH